MRRVRGRNDDQLSAVDRQHLVEAADHASCGIRLLRLRAVAFENRRQTKPVDRRDHGSVEGAPGKSESNQTDIDHVVLAGGVTDTTASLSNISGASAPYSGMTGRLLP